jgi:hypothetical protein
MTARSSASRLSVPDLVTALRRALYGADWNRRAATELLIAHEVWLSVRMLREHIHVDTYGGGLTAWIHFSDVAEDLRAGSPKSSSEQAVLRLACSLAGNLPSGMDDREAEAWSLGRILGPLDNANSALAVEAVRYAACGPEQPGSAR